MENTNVIPEMNRTIAIDLAQYGGNGTVTVGRPTFRKKLAVSNTVAKYSPVVQVIGDDGRTESVVDITKCSEVGTVGLINALSYVTAAPWKLADFNKDGNVLDINSFLDYLDIPTIDSGGLINALNGAMKELNEEGNSPLAESVPEIQG